MKISKVLMMGVATLGLATLANAGTESFSIVGGINSLSGFNMSSTNPGLSFTNGGLLPYFNASNECPGCTLTSATFSLGGIVLQQFDLINTTNAAGAFNLTLKDTYSLTPQVAGVAALNAGQVILTNGYSTQFTSPNIIGALPFPDSVGDLATIPTNLTNNCAFVIGNPGNVSGASGSSACGTFASLGNTAYSSLTGVNATYSTNPVLTALTYSSGPTGYASLVSTLGLDSSTFQTGTVDHTTSYSAGSVTVAYTYSTPSTSSPEPVSMILFGTGLSALALIGRKRFSRS